MRLFKKILIVIVFCAINNAEAQYFPDSLVATGVQTLPSVSQGYLFFLRYYRDSLTYDSTNSLGDFYTVQKRIVEGNGGGDTASFMLRVSNKRTYLTGTVRYAGKNIALNNLMIYDYNHNLGDTFIVRLNGDTSLDYHFRMDSLKMIMYEDGIKRITYFYTLRQGSHTFSRPVFSAEGLGSSLGLVYLRIDESPLLEDQLISDCTPSTLIYGNKDCNIYRNPAYHINPYCEEDSIRTGLARAIAADIERTDIISGFRVYPNPASHQLFITMPVASHVSIIDHTGRTCISDKWYAAGTQMLDLTSLSAGIYFIELKAGDVTHYKKITVIK